MSGVTIGIAHRHIVVAGVSDAVNKQLRMYVYNNLYKFKLSKQGRSFKLVPDKPFAISNGDGSIWRFHKNSLEDIEAFLRAQGVTSTREAVVNKPPKKVSFVSNTDKTPYENQPIVIKYLTDPTPVTKLVRLQTGKGKTFCALHSMMKLGMRTVIEVPRMYVGIWIEAVREFVKLKGDHSLVLVDSGAKLANLMRLSRTKEFRKNNQIIILQTGVVLAYCNHYKENYKCDEYLVPPWELFSELGVGLKIVDEVHKLFHQHFYIDLWTDAPITYNLSATMDSSDSEKNRFYNIAFPINERCPFIPYDKFIKVVDYRYYIDSGTKIRFVQPGMGTYSHVQFEESVSTKKRTLENWLNCIRDACEEYFFQIAAEGEKLLILCSTRVMAGHIEEAFKRWYGDKFKVGKYLQEDDYEVLSDLEVIVSTVLSAGTGVDIKKLRTNVVSLALSSRESNEQTLGRTRKFLNEDDDHRPFFVFMTCQDIPKHRDYATQKKDYFSDKCYSFDLHNSSFRL